MKLNHFVFLPFLLFCSEGYFEFSVNVIKGSNVLIPCYYPTFGQRGANALWFKEDGSGNRIKLDTEDESAEDKRVELLYLGDPDQTIMLRKAVMEDAGLYTCESPDGEKFTTANLSVQGSHPFLSFTLIY